MCWLVSSKAGCIRWPVQVFSNKVGITGINSHVVIKMVENLDMP